MTDAKRLSETLCGALTVRHALAALEAFARQLALLSINAKVASARIGESGRPFTALTREITGVSGSLDATVARIRDLTRRWTRELARALDLERNDAILAAAAGRRAAGSHFGSSLQRAQAANRGRLEDALRRSPALHAELRVLANEMNRTLQIVDYIKIALLVESSHLPREALAQGNPFAHLAAEMQQATDSIRGIAALAIDSDTRAA